MLDIRHLKTVAILLGACFSAAAPIASAQSFPEGFEAVENTRSVDFESSFSSQADVQGKLSIWRRMLDFVAGPPNLRRMVRPYGVTTDSRGRVLVTDPGALTVHLFDFEKNKYRHLDGGHGERFESPIGIVVDSQDSIYVTDSRLGKIFVFDAKGKFRRFLGEAKGEGIFKRPTGIAIDPVSRHIYVSDTLHHRIYVLGPDGTIVRYFGGRGEKLGQFNFPTELAIRQGTLFVLDAMNFRIQMFDLNGRLRGHFGAPGDQTGMFHRPKGLGIDSESNIYVVDALFETVQIFNMSGQLLYYFGGPGENPGEFHLPAGLFVGKDDRIYVADSYNQRIQVFRLVHAGRATEGSP